MPNTFMLRYYKSDLFDNKQIDKRFTYIIIEKHGSKQR